MGRNKLTLEEEIAAEEEAEERARQAEQDRIKEELQDELRNTGKIKTTHKFQVIFKPTKFSESGVVFILTGSRRDDLWGMMMGDDVDNSATRRDAVILGRRLFLKNPQIFMAI